MANDAPYNLIFSCSGAADVGGIADRAARKLAAEADASLCCAAAVAAGISPILKRTAWAAKIVAIDGCDKACARRILEEAGRGDCVHLELGALGMVKGQTPENDADIERVVEAGKAALKGASG